MKNLERIPKFFVFRHLFFVFSFRLGGYQRTNGSIFAQARSQSIGLRI